MRGSSSDDVDEVDVKVRKRRQQKRDYATRKRQLDKQILQSLEMQNKALSRDSRRQKQVIQRLKAWATYAQSYLSLCSQLLTFRTSPATPQGHQQSLEKSDHPSPQKAPPAVQTDATLVTEGLEDYEGLASPGQSACRPPPSPPSLQDAEGVDAPRGQLQTASSPPGGGKAATAQTTPEVRDICQRSLLMSPEADRRSPCPSVASSEADRRSSSEEGTFPDLCPPDYLLVTEGVTDCELSDPNLLYLLCNSPVSTHPLHHAVSQLCPVSITDYTWGQSLQDFVTEVTSTDDITEPDSTQESSGWPRMLSLG